MGRLAVATHDADVGLVLAITRSSFDFAEIGVEMFLYSNLVGNLLCLDAPGMSELRYASLRFGDSVLCLLTAA
jgi:hypothetical protein